MATEQLFSIAKGAVYLLTSLLLAAPIFPIFLLWRTLLLLLLIIEAPLSALSLSPRLHKPFHALYLTTWKRFLALPPLVPIAKHWTRIVVMTLLTLQTGLALTIFIKSSILFFPFLFNWTKKAKHDRLVHTVVFVASCAPLASVFGVGSALFYYARKYWKYGKFEKKMRRKPGGRGYWLDPTDSKDKAKTAGGGGGGGVKAKLEEKMVEFKERFSPHRSPSRAPWPPAGNGAPKLEGYKRDLDPGFMEVVFQQEKQEGGVLAKMVREEAERKAPQAPTPVWNQNAFTMQGVKDIWGGGMGVKERLKARKGATNGGF